MRDIHSSTDASSGPDGECWEPPKDAGRARLVPSRPVLTEPGPRASECALPGTEPGHLPAVCGLSVGQGTKDVPAVRPPHLGRPLPWPVSSPQHPFPTVNVQSCVGRSPPGRQVRFLLLIHPLRLFPSPRRHPPRGLLPVWAGSPTRAQPGLLGSQLWAGSCQRPPPVLSHTPPGPRRLWVSCALVEALPLPLHCCPAQTLLQARVPAAGEERTGGGRRASVRAQGPAALFYLRPPPALSSLDTNTLGAIRVSSREVRPRSKMHPKPQKAGGAAEAAGQGFGHQGGPGWGKMQGGLGGRQEMNCPDLRGGVCSSDPSA